MIRWGWLFVTALMLAAITVALDLRGWETAALVFGAVIGGVAMYLGLVIYYAPRNEEEAYGDESDPR